MTTTHASASIIAVLDVHYGSTLATTGCVLFNTWLDSRPATELVTQTHVSRDYIPGCFYLRELPCLLNMLAALPVRPGVIVVDGHVWLQPCRPGLGGHLYEALNSRTPVIGVAKNPFKGSAGAIRVLRGNSRKPLLVTAAGLSPEYAAACIQSMAGPHRLPFMLKRADQLARGR